MTKILIIFCLLVLAICVTPGWSSQNNSKCGDVPLSTYDDFEMFKEKCLSNPSCNYIPPGPCYCPPESRCTCGGGKAPACVVKEQQEKT